jgi:aspartyl/asparaginyl beta-hydroxylase (cupin superfamily)/Tfp pilus assembly protein PilF
MPAFLDPADGFASNAIMPSPEIQRHLAAAAQAKSTGRKIEALKHFQAVADLDPAQPLARNALGLSALESGNVSEAIEHFTAATVADPSGIALWMNLAKAHRLSGDDAAERAALEQALSIDRIHLMSLIRLAELHERRNEVGSATDCWAMVLNLCSQFPDLTPELQAMIAHASAFVAAQQNALAAAVDSSLAKPLAAASDRDRRRASAAADFMLGRRKAFANQCHGFFYPFLPPDEFFDRDHFPWLEQLEAATSVIREELEAILVSADPGLSPYIEMPPGTPRNLWSELDHSPDWSALHLWRDGERIDAVCVRAPRTTELVESLPLANIPGRAPAVFFSILKAGRQIPPHTGVTNIRTIIHLPLIVPEDCGFRVGGETRQWREGEAFAFDDTIEHEAWNRSDQDRALLILDCWNPHLSTDEQKIILSMFATSQAQRPDKPLRG